MFILLLSFNQTVEAEPPLPIKINEVMYFPVENDHYNEWIELFNPTSFPIDVNNWTLYDGQEEDIIIGDSDHGDGSTVIAPGGYAIITDHGTKVYENFTVSESAVKLYVDDSAICGYGLNNGQEKLFLNDTSRTVVDTVEWGYDYFDVPGLPANNVNKGNSLARYHNTDTNNSIIDFYYGIMPTPGSKNEVNFDIDLYPLYVPKIQCNKEYSVSFAIKVNIINLNFNESYRLKSFAVGNLLSIWPATQTWNGVSWKYSNNYTSTMITDEYGKWSGWQYLRFKKDYQEYKRNIENSSEAYLTVKIKNDNISYKIIKKVLLLDMDESTLNGTKGGYAIGRAEKHQEFLGNKTVVVENKIGTITGIYLTEDNGIEDDLVPKPGYYKIASPVGSGYTLKFLNGSNLIHFISNINIEQGNYGVKIQYPETYYLVKRNELLDIPLIVKNVGDFSDAIDVKIDSITDGWEGTLDKSKISLNPGEMSYVNLHIIPCQKNSCKSGNISIYSTSENDVGASDETTITIDILAPDLTITNLTCFDTFGQKNNRFGEGETVKIKARIKNLGNENATDVDVMFYHDFKDKNHFIGSKHYDSISKYQKYPSVEWDTTDLEEGKHTIFVIVDEENNIEEIDESNNEFSMQVEIHSTSPVNASKSIVLTEIYYHTHARVNNEFVAIYNPTNNKLNISGWYVTNTPWKNVDEQTKIIFPEHTIIFPKTSLYITQNASAFQREIGKIPDFEYAVDSTDQIPQMTTSKTLRLSNTGGAVALKDHYNHTVDVVVYGETEYNASGWNVLPVNKSGAGVVLKRNVNRYGVPVDFNTSSDWIHPRRYGIGQSDFPYVHLSVTGEITTFVSPDCSFKTIVDELRNASESIYFNIYEFTNPFLCDELVAALKRNVSVNVFLEGSPVGGIDERERFILNRIRNNGGNIRLIVNDQKNDVYARYTFDHGKYLVIDNNALIVESCNWAKTGIPIDPTFGNREWGIVVKSENVANYFLNVFLDDWNPQRCDSYSFDDMDFSISADFFMDKSVYKGSYEPQFESKTFTGNFTAVPVFSPDASERAICNLIESANTSIYIEQLYIYKDWKNKISPFVERLVNKSNQGVDIKIILNYNPYYEATNEKCNQTKQYFEENGIEVKFLYTNWSYFTNVHNKGMIVDNKSVLIASINWNENSVTRNREAGIIIENEEIATYYAEVFFYDWELGPPTAKDSGFSLADYKNPLLIVLIYGVTFALVASDWRKRKWT